MAKKPTLSALRTKTLADLERYQQDLDKQVQDLRAEAKRVQGVIDVKATEARAEVLAAAGNDDQEVGT